MKVKKTNKLILAGLLCAIVLVMALSADIDIAPPLDQRVTLEPNASVADAPAPSSPVASGSTMESPPNQEIQGNWVYWNLTNAPSGTKTFTNEDITDAEGIQINEITCLFTNCTITGDLVAAQGALVALNHTRVLGGVAIYNSAHITMLNDTFVGYDHESLLNVTCHDSSRLTIAESNVSGIIETFNTSTVNLQSHVELNGTWMHDDSSLTMSDATNVSIGRFQYSTVLVSAFLQDNSTATLCGNATVHDDVMMTHVATLNLTHTQLGGVLRSYSDGFGLATNLIDLHKTNHTGLYEEAVGVWPNLTILIEGSSQISLDNCSISHSTWLSGDARIDADQTTFTKGLFCGVSSANSATSGIVESSTIGEYPSVDLRAALWLTGSADVAVRDSEITAKTALGDSSKLLMEGTTTISGAIETRGASLLQLCDETAQSDGLVNVTGNSTLVTFSAASTAPVHLETGGLSLEYSDVSRWDAFSDSCRVNITAVDDVSSPATSVVRTVEDVCDEYDLSSGTKMVTIDLTAEQSGDKIWIWSVYRNPRVGVHFTPVVISNTPIPGKAKPAPRPAEAADDEIEDVEPWVRPTTWWDRNHWAVLISVGIAMATGLLAMYAGRSGILVGIAERWDRVHPYRLVAEKQKRAVVGKKMETVRVKIKKSKRLRTKLEIRRKLRIYFLVYGTVAFILWGILWGTWPSWFTGTFRNLDTFFWRLWAALSI